MKLKTNKLLTLTLASSLVAITAGCGGTKAAAPKTGTTTTTAPDVVYSAWSGSDDVTIVAVDTDNAFLAGAAATTTPTVAPVTLTGLDSAIVATTLNLNSIVTPAVVADSSNPKDLNAVRLNGEDGATNGVAFAATAADTTARYVAGLIAGADLGQPLTSTTVTGTWAGLFQAVGADPIRKAFTLTVTFSATADDTISALIPVDADSFTADAMSYYLSGTYDADGVITGNILYGDFSATATDTAGALGVAETAFGTATDDAATGVATNGVGTLSGLIGENGVLGAFYSSGDDGEGATGFAGGFVASKNPDVGGDDPDTVYADWADAITQAANIDDNAFLAGTADGLTGATGTPVVINLNTVVTPVQQGTAGNVNTPTAVPGTPGSRLGGEATDGVAFGMNGTTTAARFFAGLLNTTDLGAPLIASTANATFSGFFQAVGVAAVDKGFTLVVTFGTTDGNTIAGIIPVGADSFTADAMSYYLSGEYNAAGVITGNILYGDFSATATDAPGALGVAETAFEAATATDAASPATDGLGELSGLIGTDGAVGAFYSNAEGATAGYAGGFVASTGANTPIAPDAVLDYTAPDMVEFSDWTATTLSTAPTTTGNAFLSASSATALSNAPSGATFTSLDMTGVTGGVLLSTHEVVTSTASFFAGLHSDTNLGAPVATTGTDLVWDGLFRAVGATGYAAVEKEIDLTVNLTDRTIDGTVVAGATTDTTIVSGDVYHIAGTFTAAGLISGKVLWQDVGVAADAGLIAANAATIGTTAGAGTLTGLIGATAAVGVFHSDATGATGYAGGFVVTPPATP